jgi:hypothetical protein
MTDQMIELYATSTDPLPPLTRTERMYCDTQIKRPLWVRDDAPDKTLCQAVLAAWARQAAAAAMPTIKEHLTETYVFGDPLIDAVTSPVTKLIGGLLSKVKGLVQRSK